MARPEPIPADLRRWLTLPSGRRLRIPPELQGNTPRARAARAAWIEKHVAGDAAAEAARRFGTHSQPARRYRAQARAAQERMLAELDLTREEVVARMGTRTKAGLNAIALMRY